ncbi:hypothetical protein [Rhizobium sp. Leaf386]|uniref:hypothetical protein n=1 Tax=Rhizobium sp. Leaf386 TaxID=1736359 RepID=UPI0007152181|nr:hypothetical protein [Rhizobium sp. Leaf386]KQT04096.1 hypothetical protein ASG50_17965 [Rhizobium sp. Leaf386]
MLVAQRVNDFVTSHPPNALCDRCICDAMNFNSHAHSAQITGALGTTSDFERLRGICNVCKEERVVIRCMKG